MKAETVFDVFKALSPQEEERFYRMLGMVKAIPRTKKKPLITREESMEYLIGKLCKKNKIS